MNPSSLQLERAFFRKVLVEALPRKPSTQPLTIESGVSAGRNDTNPARYQVSLTVRLPETAAEGAGYSAHIEVVGLFLADAIPPTDRERLVPAHAATLLFGMVREMLASLTARGPWPMVTLPTVSFAGIQLHAVSAEASKDASTAE